MRRFGHENSRLPDKKSKRRPLTEEQKASSHQLSSVRFVMEHIIRSGKIFRIKDISDIRGALPQPAQAFWTVLQPDCRPVQLWTAQMILTQEVC